MIVECNNVTVSVSVYLILSYLHAKVEDRKDSDDEKSDRNRPWWKKRFVSAIPKGKEKKHLVILSTPSFLKLKNELLYILKSDLFDCGAPFCFSVTGK